MLVRHVHRLFRAATFAAAASFVVFGDSPVAAQQVQLDENCTVSILNRTALVQPNGTWVLPNVPANFGQVRARATCISNGVTTTGQTAFFSIPPNGSIDVPPIVFGAPDPIPERVEITASTMTLTQAGQTVQLQVTAFFTDGTSRDITDGSNGTNYTVSNPATATVDANGLVTAVMSGTVIVSAMIEGALGVKQFGISFTGDSDGDGIDDDVELANGLNPDNPIDGLEDPDGDGLTNKQELVDFGTSIALADSDGDGIADGEEVIAGADGFVTNPLLADSDGDGVRDGLEVATGSDPNNPGSLNLAAALQSIDVTPPSTSLVFNTVDGDVPRQLTVTGTLTDGNPIDLTSVSTGTSYQSSDLAICNFGVVPGEVFAGNNGICTVTATNSGFTDTAVVVVQSFSPTPLSFVDLPGNANNVDVVGNFAYVALGSAGLQVVDISDRRQPVLLGRIGTFDARDVQVVGTLAYVADAPGLTIFDVSDPLNPTLLGTTNFQPAGFAGNDVVVRGTTAYVAADAFGLGIVDISDPTAPSLVRRVDTPGIAFGVDVVATGQLAAIADGFGGLQLVDISSPGTESIIGSFPTNSAQDVALVDGFAFIADQSQGFVSIDISDPTSPGPSVAVDRNFGGLLNDVVVDGDLAFGADFFFVNGVPIIDTSVPGAPIPNSILDFRAFRDDNGDGVAVDGRFVYLAANRSSSARLYIGQYRQLIDDAGIPPSVAITSPVDGDTVVEGSTVTVTAEATDDVAVLAVNFLVDGNVVATDTSAPYQFSLDVPTGVNSVSVRAEALDFASNLGASSVLSLNIDVDTDSDGLADSQEIALGTDPNNPDTDGDGLSDGDEIIVQATDPLNADTDGDGISDGFEVANGLDPIVPDDGLSDADSDGLTLAQEFTAGTNPNIADTDADGLKDGEEVSVAQIDQRKWDRGKSRRAIADGVLNITNSIIGLNNPDTINSIEFDLGLTRIAANGSISLSGTFYNDGQFPGLTDGSGDISATILAVKSGPDMITLFAIANRQINATTGESLFFESVDIPFPFPNEPPPVINISNALSVAQTQFGGTVPIGIDFDGQEFVFTLGEETRVFDVVAQHPVAGPPQVSRKSIGASGGFSNNLSPVSDNTIAQIDNLQLNGALADEFSAPQLDSNRYLDFDLDRRLVNETLISDLRHFGTGRPSNAVAHFGDGINEVQADVTVLSSENNGALPRARIVNRFYNDGTPGGQSAGNILAQLDIRDNGTNLVIAQRVYRCENPDCSQTTDLLFDDTTFGTVTPGDKRTLRIGFDGSLFTFDVDGQTSTFDPTATAPVASPPFAPRLTIGTRVQDGASPTDNGSISARYDNIFVNGALFDDFSPIDISDPLKPDTDGDTLSDGVEVLTHGTDPGKPDTDDGGVRDDFEVANGFDPLNSNDDTSDQDGDGLTLVEEIAAGTDFNNGDTDSDGIQDGEELVAGVDGFVTDPLNADTDGDGIKDGVEVAQGLDPLNPADGASDADQDGLTLAEELNRGTDPNNRDTDGDGLNDGFEVAQGLDPLTPDTVFDDFRTSGLVDATKWSSFTFVRKIENGKWRSILRRRNSSGSNSLNIVEPTTVQQYAADVTLVDVKKISGFTTARARLFSRWYNDGTPGGGRAGDVGANIGIRETTNGSLIVLAFMTRCDNADCTQTTSLFNDSTSFGPVNLGETHRLSMGFDGTDLVFGFDDQTVTVNVATVAPNNGPAVEPNRFMGTRIISISGGEDALVEANFDNVEVNGQPYDDFSGGVFDPTKWIQQEFVREILDGVLQSQLSFAGSSGSSNHLNFVDRTVDPTQGVSIEADITVASIDNNGATATARISPTLYNDGSGPGRIGDVLAFASIEDRGNGLEAWGSLRRCLTEACNTGGSIELLSEQLLGPANLGQTHHMSLDFDGADVTFDFDGAQTVIDAGQFAPIVGPSTDPVKRIGTRIQRSQVANASGEISATFDNVTVDGVTFDDFFTRGQLDQNKWNDRHRRDRIVDGKLRLQRLNAGSSFFLAQPPVQLTSLGADIALEEVTQSSNSFTSGLIEGVLYNDGSPGGGRAGDINASVEVRRSNDATNEIFGFMNRCLDEFCNSREFFNFTQLAPGPVTLGEEHNVAISYVPGTSTVTYLVDGQQTPVDLSQLAPFAGPAVFSGSSRLSMFTADNLDPNSFTAASFDNVVVNGVLLDDFNSGRLDPTKWANVEREKVQEDGKFVSTIASFGATRSDTLNFVDAAPITGFQADVTILEFENVNATPRARLTGRFFNDGSAGGGETGDVGSEVALLHNGTSLIARVRVFRCPNADCTGGTETLFVDNTTFGNVSVGDTHTLSLDFDGSKFIFGFDGATLEFTPPGAVAGPSVDTFKGMGSRISAPFGTGGVFAAPSDGGFMSATFDNVIIRTAP